KHRSLTRPDKKATPAPDLIGRDFHAERPGTKRCVIHSDRGSEYTSTQFRARMRELGLRQSCGRTGSCFDNAAAESFWALLKEEIGTRIWPDRATARAEVFNFIERPCCPIRGNLRRSLGRRQAARRILLVRGA
ncbi:hypothetical protein ABZ656_55985, partial [Streptomyces sp. NPDC007095]